MQSALRASVFLCTCSSAAYGSRQPCPASTSGRVSAVLPTRRIVVRRQAVKNEDAELERIAREANQADLWDNELIGNVLKVALVAGLVAVGVFIGRLGQPIFENTIRSFPTPADYEAYEESK